MSGLELTLKALSETANESSAEMLVFALASPYQPIVHGAVRCIIERRSARGESALIERWQSVDDSTKELIAEHPGRMSKAARNAILNSDQQLCENGCKAALDLREYDLFSVLINAVEDESNNNRDLAGRTLLELSELLYADIASSDRSSRGRDPQRERQHAVNSLELSVKRFFRHKRLDVLEAFLLLAHRENATLRRILQNPHDAAYLPMVELMTTCERPGVIRLVLGFLEDSRAPSAATTLLSRRSDKLFLKHFLAKIGFEPSRTSRANLKRMWSIQWLQGDLSNLDELTEEQQHSTVQLAMKSSMNRLDVFEVIRHLAKRGKPAGRRAATSALAEFRGIDANELAADRLGNDDDPQVIANILLQVRDRGVAGAMKHLIESLDSPHEVIQQAARDCLDEFNIERFLSAYDMIEDSVRISTGLLVRKVDLETIPVLERELRSPSRTRKMRAIGAVAAMRLVTELEERIIGLLQDEDHFVRSEAATALSRSDSETSRSALRDALLDRSASVQQAAERSLQILAKPAGEQATTDVESFFNHELAQM